MGGAGDTAPHPPGPGTPQGDAPAQVSAVLWDGTGSPNVVGAEVQIMDTVGADAQACPVRREELPPHRSGNEGASTPQAWTRGHWQPERVSKQPDGPTPRGTCGDRR